MTRVGETRAGGAGKAGEGVAEARTEEGAGEERAEESSELGEGVGEASTASPALTPRATAAI